MDDTVIDEPARTQEAEVDTGGVKAAPTSPAMRSDIVSPRPPSIAPSVVQSHDDSLATPARSSGSEDTVVSKVGDSLVFDHAATPTQADTSDASISFMFPSRSYDIQHFSNIKDAIPEWEDDEVDELVVLSEKERLLHDIDESQEISHSASGTTISNFSPVQSLSSHNLVLSSSSSNVALFLHKPSSAFYAIKTFTKSCISYDTPTLEHAMKEQMVLRLLTQMEIPFVLKLRWSFQDAESMRLVTDYCFGGDLRTRIAQTGTLTTSLTWLYAAEIAEAISSLHASGICHRSIRPEHILIGEDGHVVLTGFSRASLTTFNSPRSEHRVAMEQRENLVRTGDFWSAPEVVLGWSHDFAVDFWAFGCILYYMLSGQHPLFPGFAVGGTSPPNPQLIESMIVFGAVDVRGCDDNADATDLIRKCLERNPRMRSTAEDVKMHEYFADINWQRLRQKGYPAPTPPPRDGRQCGNISLDTLGIQESETLRGVHIASFNYEYTPDARCQRMDISGDDVDDFYDDQQLTPLSADSETLEDLPTTLAEESTYVTPACSLHSSLSGTAPSASTALYSCTSFGELRDALKTRASEKSILAFPVDQEFQSNTADQSATSGAQRVMLSKSRADDTLRPTSILLRNDSRATSLEPEPDLAPCGLGLRKYASLNFDLDTVVPLEPNPAASDCLATLAPPAHKPTRRVSFLDAMASPADTIVAPGSSTLEGMSSPWKNLSRYYSPTPNENKLRKKRNASVPLFPDTPRLQEKVALPDGVQQIGLGIGYTCARSGQDREKDREKEKERERTPRTRALSVGSSVARCGALLSHIRRPKTAPGAQDIGETEKDESERASEESDAMEAVMREMYGAAWNPEFGVGYLGGGTGGAGGSSGGGEGVSDRAVSSRRRVGKVYSVDDAAADGLFGSTLRLVPQTPSSLEAHLQ